MKTVLQTGPSFAVFVIAATCNFSLKKFIVTQCVIAEFRTSAAAKLALEALEVNKFTLEEVSVVSGVDDPAAAPIAAATMIDPFIVAGPLLGMAVGAAVGGLLKSTSEWGVDLDATKDYERRVREGAVLIIVHSENRVSLDEAEAVLKTIGPDSIRRFA